jgi:dihydrofolate reductase
MAKVVLDISMSLDGFVAGLSDTVKSPLHDWLFNGDTPSKYNDFLKLSKKSAKVFDELVRNTGSIITGRRTYNITGGWGGSHPVNDSVFVLSHDTPSSIPDGSTTFAFHNRGREKRRRTSESSSP